MKNSASAAFAGIGSIAVGWLVARAAGFGPIDDAFISLRYARNWAEGLGLCFNPGDRVEGYTNFLLVAVEAFAARLGVDPEHAMTAIGWASLGAIAVVLQVWIARHILPGRTVLAAFLAIVGSANLALVAWAASGMETVLYAALILAATLASIDRGRIGGAVTAAILLVGAAMTRPEAVALVPVLGLFVYRRQRRIGDVVRFGLTFLAPYGTYFVARWTYFGDPLPNTFYAKLDYGNLALATRGVGYVASFAVATALLTVLCIVGTRAFGRTPEWVRAASSVVVTLTAVAIYEGGDHFALFRFMAPAIPLMELVALYAIARLCDLACPARSSTATPIIGVAVLGVSAAMVGVSEHRDDLGKSHVTRFALEAELAREWTTVGTWLRRAAPRDATLATIAVGAIGYHSRLGIVDPHGIVNREVARLDIELGHGYAGHEKFDVQHVLVRQPTYCLLLNRPTGEPVTPRDLPDRVWGEFNRDILAAPAFSALYRYGAIEIEPGSFIGLHVRRGAPVPGAGAGSESR